MRVLITRPELQGRRTAEKLAALGHDPVLFPLFRPQHMVDVASQALAGRFFALAATSAEALRCLAELAPSLDAHLAKPIFVVGRMTAKAAADLGFQTIISSSGNGADLGPVIGERLSEIAGNAGPILYLTSRRRSGGLERSLTELGVTFEVAEIYDMERVDYALDEQQRLLVNRGVDAVFLYSRENARTFFALDVFQTSREALRKTLFFCLSRNIAEAVPDEFRKSTVVSLNPDEDELIDLL